MTLSKALLCTLGPSSLNRRVISQLEAVGASTFRVNMSHTDIADLERVVHLIQECTSVPISIDTEGAQIRTGAMNEGVAVTEGSRLRLVPEGIKGDATTIPLRPGNVIEKLEPGARMSIDYDSVLVEIDKVSAGAAEATVITSGEIGSRRSVSVLPSPRLPAFSEKDRLAIRFALQAQIHQFALSFCRDQYGIDRLREMVGSKSTIIAKVETREGVRNLGAIAESADAILIDRGDLSREVRIQAIPLLQKAIIHKANAVGTPVYVATNLLESMMTRRGPTRAEVNDVINTLLDGADGLVLAQETAIEKYPVEAARMIAALLKEYEGSIAGYRIEDLLGEHPLANHLSPRDETSRL